MSVEHINPDTLFVWPQMAQISIASAKRLAFIAGQTGNDKNFNMVGCNDLGAQTHAAFQNLLLALEAVGAKPEDVVSSTIYIVNLNEKKSAIFAEAMDKALDGKRFPPHSLTMVGVTGLGGDAALIEMSAVAVLPN